MFNGVQTSRIAAFMIHVVNCVQTDRYKVWEFSASYPRTDSSTQHFHDIVHISNVTGWNDRPSQKHNFLGQNIYTEADRNHLQQVHSRNRVETTRQTHRALFLSVQILVRKVAVYFRHLCKVAYLTAPWTFLLSYKLWYLFRFVKYLGNTKRSVSERYRTLTRGDISLLFSILFKRLHIFICRFTV